MPGSNGVAPHLRVDTEPSGNDALLAGWKQRLADLTELLLPTDYPRPIPSRVVEADQVLHVSEKTSLAILQLSLAVNSGNEGVGATVTPFTILLAAFAVLLHRHSGESDITVGSSSTTSNPLVLRFPVTADATFRSVIRAVLEAELDATTNEVPFQTLLNALVPPLPSPVKSQPAQQQANPHQPSLFKVRFFNLTDTNQETLASTTTSSSCDITIFISQEPTLRRLLPIDIRIVYNSVLFAHSRITDMLEQLQLVLEGAAANIDSPIGAISLVSTFSRPLLPDPAADLHYDGFEGAITDIFARNAQAHPDRVCVVESRDTNVSPSLAPLREFSYQAINEASNVLAHHLLRNGIQREDVVVLYSYRGVDLVVAVMGVLKAGAIFSVIDPAYPPSRQNIYLSVAVPRGLVVLAKAGELDQEVKEYVANNLDIVCMVPSLLIHDDGNLTGGLGPDGNDIFGPDAELKGTAPDVVLGPDSGSTLSFTSGSTGIPKGVKGRHFSLTHFYPWMKETFGITENERFTMLSGIAHDPIQRDIFTPLFLGAQLRIPTSEDIGLPGRLAEWMAHHGITVTHLTPAMGQLLSANATTPIPTLRNAFFVGDVLTKRDVLRLQYLAENVHVVNMYGTTETQRAVSHLIVPPSNKNPGFLSELKDIIPAGKGMIDVQLLVVNPAGALCGIGEVGEIYVRSSGLAEGYLDEEAKAAKFVANPFGDATKNLSAPQKAWPYYLGPRDRCYRTGDLGRYLPNGSVECTGRADDQVKIRGFRIELKEIDTHLSQCPQVRENVSMVKRDKDEEKVLISYIVPVDSTENVASLVAGVREYLKGKLPSYAVPGVIVPLKRMPLTPNGKVDKNALPFPDTALLASLFPAVEEQANAASLTTIETAVREIWSSVLRQPTASIGLDDNFFDIGGHSILATQLVFMIRKNLRVDVPLGIVYKTPTVRGMSGEVERYMDSELGLVSGGGGNERRSPTLGSRPKGDADDADTVGEVDYAADLETLDAEFPITTAGLSPTAERPGEVSASFFATGVTGFLGAFIVADLLNRSPNNKVTALVRAKSTKDAIDRIRTNSSRYLVWNEDWVAKGRLTALCGDLAQPRLGLSEAEWAELSRTAHVVIHNGALVHWVYPYHKLRAANVLSTLWCLRLATTTHVKPVHFVSSTSVLDTPHYVRKLDTGTRVYEDDDLMGAKRGLRSGYGQTKWVAEQLVVRARKRNRGISSQPDLPTTIIRPGYIVGSTTTGVTNTDDFIWRLVKGCVDLGRAPRIANAINMCPVDYVAAVVGAVATDPYVAARSLPTTNGDASTAIPDNTVFHCYNPEGFSFNDLFAQLAAVGYRPLQPTDYIHWRTSLMDFVLSGSSSSSGDDTTTSPTSSALFPLLHFVVDDLPTSTKSPVLDTTNAERVLARAALTAVSASSAVQPIPHSMRALMPLYIGFLVHTGFLRSPTTAIANRTTEQVEASLASEVAKPEDKRYPPLPSLDCWNGVHGSAGRTGA
ncbi:uncharacterized protein EV422DRAFT_586674 [Fimicolochytrium jonesii]|uniref:uncharacterized protein n=1 Tax=Fimicolochytrium jonesii TaxID=1396493 RepID=UPI0022FF311B|nr:uncharacterized protein EV422DRAFT_586674 [Fimicolochytrium jonesii]KAI8821825.1 hypothetical protein EV422DRAFT_586674 [Fimicolochytrium jonesii]